MAKVNILCAEMEAVYVSQKYFEPNETAMLFLSHLGDPRNAFLLLFPLSYCLEKGLGLKILWASTVTEWFNVILKWCVLGDRPFWFDEKLCGSTAKVLKQFSITCESGPGFPSGHVMCYSSLSLLLLLHCYDGIREKKIRIAFLIIAVPVFFALVALVSLSRIYIAAHFPHQVMAGAFFGVSVALVLHMLTRKYSPSIMFSYTAFLIGMLSLMIAFLLYGMLFYYGFNPSSTVELALRFCKSREWVHLDTTLFSAVTRDAGCLCAVGVASAFVKFVFGKVEGHFIRSNPPFYSASNVISASIVCPFVYSITIISISQTDILRFYVLYFCKFFLLPIYVFTFKYILEIVFEYLFKKKCKKL